MSTAAAEPTGPSVSSSTWINRGKFAAATSANPRWRGKSGRRRDDRATQPRALAAVLSRAAGVLINIMRAPHRSPDPVHGN